MDPHTLSRTIQASAQAAHVLVVDDDTLVCTAIGRLLTACGYRVTLAHGGYDALEVLRRERFAAVLCDLNMPTLSGIELLRRTRQIEPDLPFVMLSGINDAAAATESLQEGASDYIVKPAGHEALAEALGRAIRMRSLRTEERRLQDLIRREVDHRTAALDAKLARLRDQTVGIVEALVNAMEAKDLYLRGHSQRVAELAACIAVDLQLEDDVVEQIRIAGRLHEVGKIGIRESILEKPGTLTDEEYRQVREYVRIGTEILAPLSFLGSTTQFVAEHHERWNGSGYPLGMRGERISLGGRILAVADTFDALTSRRPHREAISESAALLYVSGLSGSEFDPQVVQALRSVVERRKALQFIELAPTPPLLQAG